MNMVKVQKVLMLFVRISVYKAGNLTTVDDLTCAYHMRIKDMKTPTLMLWQRLVTFLEVERKRKYHLLNQNLNQ